MNTLSQALLTILQAVIIAVIPVATTYLCQFLKSKQEEAESATNNTTVKALLAEAVDAVCTAVTSTNQTYVDTLKKSGTFTLENQQEAFQKSYETAIAIMSQETKDFIASAYGSLSEWLTAQIEAQVKTQKDGTATLASTAE
ncbi:MAG: hypothetical protein LUD19_03355 [Clostridia bacterium]|nr:hypothetical protein [Clostridia bacterium]